MKFGELATLEYGINRVVETNGVSGIFAQKNKKWAAWVNGVGGIFASNK